MSKAAFKTALLTYSIQVQHLAYFAWLCFFPIVGSILLAIVLDGLPEGSEILAIYSRQLQAGLAFPLVIVTLLAAIYCIIAVSLAAAFAIWGESMPPGAGNLIPVWVSLIVVTAVAPLFFQYTLPLPPLLGFYAVMFLILPLPGAQWAEQIGKSLTKLREYLPGVWATVLLVIGAALFAAIVIEPVGVPRSFGALAILCFAVGFWSLGLTLLFVAMPRRAKLPSFILVALALVLLFERWNDDKVVRVCQDLGVRPPCTASLDAPTPPPQPPPATVDRQVKRWIARACPHASAQARCPMIFIAAAGGGLRAAYWSAGILDRLNDETQGSFFRHVFAISTVSGGSLGSAAFIAANIGNGTGAQYRTVSDKVHRFLTQDYLSPIVASLVFPEVLQRFIPVPIPRFDRSVAFERAFEESWRSVFCEPHKPCDPRMSRDFRSLWSRPGAQELPSLFMNSTNVETGKRFIISNLLPSGEFPEDAYYAYDPKALYRITDLPLSTAIHLSSRFTYVSPAAVLRGLPSSAAHDEGVTGAVIWGRLVDGGYYENSGAVTLDEVFNETITALNGSRTVQPFVLVLLNDPHPAILGDRNGDVPPLPSWPREVPPPYLYGANAAKYLQEMRQGTTPWSEYTAPISTYLATRDAHSTQLRNGLELRMDTAERDCLAAAPFDYVATLIIAAQMRKNTARVHYGPTCGQYSEISYATVGTYLRKPDVLDTYQPVGKSTGRYAQPALGWVLSCESQRSMDDAIANIDAALQDEPVAQIEYALGQRKRGVAKHDPACSAPQ